MITNIFQGNFSGNTEEESAWVRQPDNFYFLYEHVSLRMSLKIYGILVQIDIRTHLRTTALLANPFLSLISIFWFFFIYLKISIIFPFSVNLKPMLIFLHINHNIMHMVKKYVKQVTSFTWNKNTCIQTLTKLSR